MAKARRQSNSNLEASINATSCVGDVIHSLLTEVQFQALRGSGWILADGRNVAGSAYSLLTGSSTVPDLRSIFLRGKNNGRSDGNQDPSGERALGHFQNDQMQGHTHTVTTYQGTNTIGQWGRGDGVNVPNNQSVGNPQNDGANGAPRTGLETRVKNVSVNIFVRIN
jgi:hypothetical protein